LKRETKKLAILGANPAFEPPLHVGKPNIPDKGLVLRLIEEALERKWLTNNGPLVTEFAERLAEYVAVRQCVPTSSGTMALELLVRQMGLTGEVIVPSFTFVATAHVLKWNGITPIFCDINPETYTLDPNSVERLITPRTTGIIGVHLWGRTCDVAALTEIAERRNLVLLFDAAQAFACSHGDISIGGFGRAEIFSFHATKVMNTFEGGAIATNDDELAASLRTISNFGFEDYDRTSTVGINGKMSEISAAMGLASLEMLPDIIAHNYRNYCRYLEALAGIPGIRLLQYEGQNRSNYHYITIEVDAAGTGLSRDELQKVLWAEGVLARRYFYPGCHRMEPYRSTLPNAGAALPITERLADRVLSLPTGTSVESEIISAICDIIRNSLSQADEVRHRLAMLDPSTP
jgi:dTDP-4-amino-4,6-dideoxygalactose transaminase